MTPDQARKRARRLEQDLLVAEAEQAALGWMYLTVEGIDIDSEPDLERYLRALDAFGEVAAGRDADTAVLRPASRSAIRGEAAGQSTRGEDASARIAVLHARLDALNPQGLYGARWDIRDGAADTIPRVTAPGRRPDPPHAPGYVMTACADSATRCRSCGRVLANRLSVILAIGPICRLSSLWPRLRSARPQLPGGNRGFDKSDQLAQGVRLAGRAEAGQLALTR